MPKVGFTGYTLSNLNIPTQNNIWERHSTSTPARIKSALDIINRSIQLGLPLTIMNLGVQIFLDILELMNFLLSHNNKNTKTIGYHKPIMLAGGIGTIRENHSFKSKLSDGDLIIILVGPSYIIGIGGGAASSLSSGSSSEDLDFSSSSKRQPRN